SIQGIAVEVDQGPVTYSVRRLVGVPVQVAAQDAVRSPREGDPVIADASHVSPLICVRGGDAGGAGSQRLADRERGEAAGRSGAWRSVDRGKIYREIARRRRQHGAVVRCPTRPQPPL